MAIGILDGQSQQLTLQASLIATGTATDVFTFQNPPTGLTWTGTLSVAPANVALSTPAGALFTTSIGSTNWGEWGGNSVYGPVQCNSSQQLVIACSGLTAGVAYIATWVGSSDPSNKVQPIYPAANSTALTSTTYQAPPGVILPAAAYTASGGNVTLTVPITASVRTLLLFISSNPGALGCTGVVVTGLQSGMVYYNQPPYLPGNIGTAPSYTVVVPVAPALDTSVRVSFTFTTAAWQGTLGVSGDTAEYPESLFYNGTLQEFHTATVATTALCLNGPFRILTASCGVANAAQTAVLLLDGVAALRVDSNTTETLTASLAFPPNTIVPAGANALYTIVGGGYVSFTYAYP